MKTKKAAQLIQSSQLFSEEAKQYLLSHLSTYTDEQLDTIIQIFTKEREKIAVIKKKYFHCIQR